jgi:3-hydroxybutyryl-CoA dehydrogenase
MGQGIAEVCLLAGLEVWLFDVDDAIHRQAYSQISKTIEKQSMKQNFGDDHSTSLIQKLHVTTSLGAVPEVDVVVEAIVEDLCLKQQLFSGLSQQFPTAMLASNTSTLSISSIFAGCTRPERGFGLHFFNPVDKLPLVEVIAGIASDPKLLANAVKFIQYLRKYPIVVKDTPGFLVNRIARPFYGEAMRLLQHGSTAEAIDASLRALGFRMGPCELMDLIGLDVNLAATTSIYRASFDDPKYRPSTIQQHMVNIGRLGQKSGRGFYDYPRKRHEPSSSSDGLGVPFKRVAIHQHDAAGVLAQILIEAGHQPVVGEDSDVCLAHLVDCSMVSATEAAITRQSPASIGYCAVPASSRGAKPQQPSLELLLPLHGNPELLHYTQAVCIELGIVPHITPDSPAGTGLRVLCCLINEACSAWEDGIASPSDIDVAMKLAMNHPHGPFAWGSRLGWPRVLAVMQGLFMYFGEDRYRPSPMLRKLAMLGEETNTLMSRQGIDIP